MLTYADVCCRMQALPAMRMAKMDSSKNHVDKNIFKDVGKSSSLTLSLLNPLPLLEQARPRPRMLTYAADVCC